jgi:RNA-directed DNA polymerase
MQRRSLVRMLGRSFLAGKRSVDCIVTRAERMLGKPGDGDFERRVERFSIHVAAILMEEGLRVNHHKTRVMRQGVRQHLAGLVTNHHINIMRADLDRLKATLVNCVRLGADTQNRNAHPGFRAHLEGRVAYVEMLGPARGRRLRAILEQIEWPRTGST